MKFEKLGNIVNIKKGKKPIFSENPKPDSIRVLQIDDLRNDDNLKFTDEKNGVFASKEDVLLVWDGANAGTIGHGKEGFIGSTIALLSKKEPKKYSTTFIGLFLQSKFDYLRSKTTGATIPHIDGKVLRNLLIPVPSIETQLHIADVLSKAENLIAQRKESIRLLDEYLKSVFLEMFGDPATNSKNWEKTTLKEVCIKIHDGTHFSPPITSEGVPYITAKHVRENKVDFWSNPWFISEESHKEIYRRCNPKKGDVLYIKDGATTGYAAINPYDFEFSMLSSLALLKPNTNITNSEFICSWLNNPNAKASILTNMAGGAIKRLTLTKINALPILLPPLELQAQFASIVEKTEALKAQYQQSLHELENLYGCLSQKAFKGELSIKDESLLIAAESETKYGEK